MGALSIELGPELGNCMKTFLVVALSTIEEISKSGVNSIAAYMMVTKLGS